MAHVRQESLFGEAVIISFRFGFFQLLPIFSTPADIDENQDAEEQTCYNKEYHNRPGTINRIAR